MNGFICERIETSARLLETRELTFGYHKNWKNYCLAEKLLILKNGFWRLAVNIDTLTYLELKIYLIIHWLFISLFFELHLLNCLTHKIIIWLFN
jgi:hypothetical protein